MENPFDVLADKLDRNFDAIQQQANKPEQILPKAEKYLTTEQVCEILSVSRVTIWNWEKTGILRSIRVGNLKRFRQSDIENFGRSSDED